MARQRPDSSKNIKAAVKALKEKGEKRVLVVGQVRNGKLEIDTARLEKFARDFPNANASFIAVNAPFAPTTGTKGCTRM